MLDSASQIVSQMTPVPKTRQHTTTFSAQPAANKLLCFASTVVLLGTLSGCQGIVSSPTLSQLRIIDASPDAPGLDIYAGTPALAYTLALAPSPLTFRSIPARIPSRLTPPAPGRSSPRPRSPSLPP